MLVFENGKGLDARDSAGVFCLVKPDGTLRLICDRRPRNFMELLMGKARLPVAARLARLLIPKNHSLRISARDLKDYYYVLKVSAQRAKLQQWGPRIPSSWLLDLCDETQDYQDAIESWWTPDLDIMRGGHLASEAPEDFYQPLSQVVLMGDLNAVFIAQEFHINLLEDFKVFEQVMPLLGDFVWKRDETDLACVTGNTSSASKTYAGVYIDDFAAIASFPRKSLQDCWSPAEVKAQEVDEVYVAADLNRSKKKDVKDAVFSKIWGPMLHGENHEFGTSRERRMLLATVSAKLLLKARRGAVWAACIGHWSNSLQTRRLAYSILQSFYPLLADLGLRKIKRVTGDPMDELLVLCCLRALLHADLSLPIYPIVAATDASEEAAGICTATAVPTTLIQLYDIAEFKGEHLRLDGGTIEFTAAENLRLAHSALLSMPLSWKTCLRHVFRFANHINVLEAQAVLLWLKRIVKQNISGKRILVLIDSAVVKGAVTKGRSSSVILNRVIRQMAGLALSYGLFLEVVWLPTWANPSDAPSRHTALSDWVKKARPYWEATLKEFTSRNELSSPYSQFAPSISLDQPQWPDTIAKNVELASAHLALPRKVTKLSPVLKKWKDKTQPLEPLPTSLQPIKKLLPSTKRNPKARRISAYVKRRALEVFAGKGGLGRELRKLGFTVDEIELLGPDGLARSDHDLTREEVFHRVKAAILRRDYNYVHFGTPCSSFSVLNILFGQGTRTRARPQGKNPNPAETLGNLLLNRTLELIDCCIHMGIHWTLENPSTSLLFLMPKMQQLQRRKVCHSIVFDQCEFGLKDPVSHLPYKKGTKVIASFDISAIGKRCQHDHTHEPVVGTVKVQGKWFHRSKLAGAYPPRLCRLWGEQVKAQLASDHVAREARLRQRGV